MVFAAVGSLWQSVPSPAREGCALNSRGPAVQLSCQFFLFFFMSFKLFKLLCLQCDYCKLRQSAREPGGSGFLGYRHLPTASASAVQSLSLVSLRTALRFNWHMPLHLIYIMWLMIPPSPPLHSSPLPSSVITFTHCQEAANIIGAQRMQFNGRLY